MSVPAPNLGPCASWITGADVAACCNAGVADPSLLDTVAVEASMAMYEISGRQFTGLCDRTVRPCADRCGCWAGSSGAGPWLWGSYGPVWWWGNECGDRCGCGSMSKIKLAGYPVREIVQVKIDGAVLPALDAHGHPNYRLDLWRELVRMDDPGPPAAARLWPSCQNMSLDDTQPGTFSISYRCGVDPPQLGRDAAAALACQLWLSCAGSSGGDCVLPNGVTRIVRQGIEVDRSLLADWFDPGKSTGLVAVDLFLRAYAGTKARRRSAVFSPDVQPFPRRVA